jgi:hypothetical protein
MTKKLERDFLAADLGAINALLAQLPADDLLGRTGLESRRAKVQQSLTRLRAQPESRAQVSLIFGGEPVRGSAGIRTDFAGSALSKYQDLVSKVFARRERGTLAARGTVPERSANSLHLTNVVHGSFGFLLEELDDEQQEEMFSSKLKAAVDEASTLVTVFGDEDEDRFAGVLAQSDQRIFDAAAEFLKYVNRQQAPFRLVAGDIDRTFNADTLQLAADRATSTQLSEGIEERVGTLIGVLPLAHRFEFRVSPNNAVIEGTVSPDISVEQLQGLYRNFANERARISVEVRQVRRPGRATKYSYTLKAVERDG